MSNELIVPIVTVTQVPHGVIDLAPPFVQPVVVTGSVSVVQPITIAQPVQVVIVSSTGAQLNIYGEVLVPFNTETIIISYTVPATQTLDLTAVEIWGDYFAEYFVRINGIQKGGTNVSSAERSKSLVFAEAPIVVTAGQILTISVQHQAMGTVKFHANLMGGLS